MSKKLIVIGGGGHCRSVLDTIIESGLYQDILILDKYKSVDQSILGIKIYGGDDKAEKLYDEGYENAFLAIGDNYIRESLSEELGKIGFKFPNVVDSSAKISKSAKLGSGIFIGKKAVVNADALIGSQAIINTGAIVEHGVSIGKFAQISPGAVLNGAVTVEDRAYIGANASVREQIRIGECSIVGMGSVVLEDIHKGKVAYGNPCREVRDI